MSPSIVAAITGVSFSKLGDSMHVINIGSFVFNEGVSLKYECFSTVAAAYCRQSSAIYFITIQDKYISCIYDKINQEKEY